MEGCCFSMVNLGVYIYIIYYTIISWILWAWDKGESSLKSVGSERNVSSEDNICLQCHTTLFWMRTKTKRIGTWKPWKPIIKSKNWYNLWETKMSHLWKRKNIFKGALVGDIYASFQESNLKAASVSMLLLPFFPVTFAPLQHACGSIVLHGASKHKDVWHRGWLFFCLQNSLHLFMALMRKQDRTYHPLTQTSPPIETRATGWWFQPIWKNISQNGNLPQIGVKI